MLECVLLESAKAEAVDGVVVKKCMHVAYGGGVVVAMEECIAMIGVMRSLRLRRRGDNIDELVLVSTICSAKQ